MDPVLDISMWIILCGAAFLAGFIDAIAGGGGMLTVPALLTAGLPPHIALATNKLASTFGTLTSSYTFYKKQLFNPKFWRFSLIATAIGAIVGTLLVSNLSGDLLDKIIPIIVLITGIYTLFAKGLNTQQFNLPKKDKHLIQKQISQGLILGFYDGAAGPGTGTFWTVSSSALYKINILLSSGVARANNFISNFFSLLIFFYLGYVNILLGLSMGLFLMIGSWIGARTAIKYGYKFIKPVFITVVLIMSINLAMSAWG